MAGSGEESGETIQPEFDRSIMIDFPGAKITSDTASACGLGVFLGSTLRHCVRMKSTVERMVDGVMEGEVRSGEG